MHDGKETLLAVHTSELALKVGEMVPPLACCSTQVLALPLAWAKQESWPEWSRHRKTGRLTKSATIYPI